MKHSRMNALPDHIKVLPQSGGQLYINRDNDQVLKSSDFSPEDLVEIARHMATHRQSPVKLGETLGPRTTRNAFPECFSVITTQAG